MGKGDKRSKKGKRIIGTSGVSRQKTKVDITATKKKKKAPKKVAAKKAAPAKSKAKAKETPVAAAAAKVVAASEDKSLKSMTVAQLREMAKGKELTGYSTMKKAELVEALS